MVNRVSIRIGMVLLIIRDDDTVASLRYKYPFCMHISWQIVGKSGTIAFDDLLNET